MQWLLTHIWASLLVAGFLGLLAGFGARGFFVSNRVRRAEVDRDVAQTELQQTRAEVDDLYAAQRKQKDAYSADQGTRENDLLQELNSRDATINNLSNALKEARDELKRFAEEQEQRSSGLAENAGAALAGAAAATAVSALSEPDEASETKITELTERNVWLQERVSTLETELTNLAASAQEAPAEAPAEPAAASQSASDISDLEPDPQLEKMHWQNSYLRQRVDALEASLVEQETTPVDVPVEPELEAPTLVAAPEVAEVAETDEAEEAPSEADEELARLRWRNRYLEGRLAYYEEGQAAAVEPEEEPVAETETAVEEAAIVSLATGQDIDVGADMIIDAEPETEESVDEVDDAKSDPEPEISDVEDIIVEAGEEEQTVETVEEAAEAEAEPALETEEPEEPELAEELVALADDAPALEPVPEAHPSDAVLQELGEDPEDDSSLIQPFAIEQLPNGGDDLTRIGGIGPRISTVLNELGIWSYAQIAEWSAENQHWIDDHLAFNGRVEREGWVEQARKLAEETQKVDA